MDAISFRTATRADLPGVVAIYNHFIERSHVTFDTRPFRVEERADGASQL